MRSQYQRSMCGFIPISKVLVWSEYVASAKIQTRFKNSVFHTDSHYTSLDVYQSSWRLARVQGIHAFPKGINLKTT